MSIQVIYQLGFQRAGGLVDRFFPGDRLLILAGGNIVIAQGIKRGLGLGLMIDQIDDVLNADLADPDSKSDANSRPGFGLS